MISRLQISTASRDRRCADPNASNRVDERLRSINAQLNIRLRRDGLLLLLLLCCHLVWPMSMYRGSRLEVYLRAFGLLDTLHPGRCFYTVPGPMRDIRALEPAAVAVVLRVVRRLPFIASSDRPGSWIVGKSTIDQIKRDFVFHGGFKKGMLEKYPRNANAKYFCLTGGKGTSSRGLLPSAPQPPLVRSTFFPEFVPFSLPCHATCRAARSFPFTLDNSPGKIGLLLLPSWALSPGGRP